MEKSRQKYTDGAFYVISPRPAAVAAAVATVFERYSIGASLAQRSYYKSISRLPQTKGLASGQPVQLLIAGTLQFDVYL